MSHIETFARQAWHADLETIGVVLFLRYRKRLMEPGIGLEIKREYPDLPLLDLLLRVYSGRRLVRRGDDFRALHAIRSGDWPVLPDSCAPSERVRPAPGDLVSNGLVALGGLLFAGFCALSLFG